MISAVLVALSLAFASQSNAHGLVSSIELDGVAYQGYPAFYDPNSPQRIIRAMHNNGPIEDVSSPPIACNGENAPAALVGNVTAGSVVTYTWDAWPEGHKGPITNYMASCGTAGCKTFDATSGKYFKVDETGYDAGVWATDKLIKNNLKYSFKIPSNIPDGQYLLRHEILALHSSGAPQYYPSCAQISVTGGSGSLPSNGLVSFPGAYSPSDPGYSFNIYYPPFTSYPIEGPAVFNTVATPGNSSSTPPSSTPSISEALPTPSATVPSASTTLPVSSASPTGTARVCALRPASRANASHRKRGVAAAPRFVRSLRSKQT